VAEIHKLSVGKTLDKLRKTEMAHSTSSADEKIDALDDEIQRLRAANRRLDRDQRAGSKPRDVPAPSSGRVTKPEPWGIVIAIVILISILTGLWWLL
jgi:hypothetical protein